MFLVLKIVEAMLSPLAIYVELTLFAILLRLFGKRILAYTVFALSFIALLFVSYDIGQDLLAAPLEKEYAVCDPRDYPEVKTIVVLGGGKFPESDKPTSAKLSKMTLARLVEGIRIFNMIDAQRLIVTGKDYTDDSSIAELMKRCAMELGVDGEKIITVDNARNTREEAKYTAEIVKGDTVFLVTSAVHLKRAVKNFGDEGVFVIPVPTDFQVHTRNKQSVAYYTPSPQRIANSGKSIHEYLGLLAELLNFKK
jgi:uncharacterized SAM-binding protein YcdF (DUF218 family)